MKNKIVGEPEAACEKYDRKNNLDEPVLDLHRMEGRFGKEAKGRAVNLSSAVARRGVGLAGLATAVAVGFAASLIVGA